MRLAVIVILLICVSGCNGKRVKHLTGLEGKTMPSFKFLLADGVTRFNTSSPSVGKPTILFSFEPWCPYSKAQTADLISDIKELKDVNIYMFCSASHFEFRSFYAKYHLERYPNIKAGTITDFSFYRYFNTSKIPLMAIYGGDNKLKEVVLGKTDIGVLKDIAIH